MQKDEIICLGPQLVKSRTRIQTQVQLPSPGPKGSGVEEEIDHTPLITEILVIEARALQSLVKPL